MNMTFAIRFVILHKYLPPTRWWVLFQTKGGINMISDIVIDFDRMKSILSDVTEQNKPLLSSEHADVLQALYTDYEPKSEIDLSNINVYTSNFAKFYKQKIINMASYCSEDKENFDRQVVNELERSGKVFGKSIFDVLRKHLFLEMKLKNKNYDLEIRIIQKLCYSIGNTYYFDFNEAYLTELFEYAVKLYLCSPEFVDTKDVETASIIKSMKNLLSIKKFEYAIKCGYIYFSDDAEKEIQFKIEQSISNIGGIEFLRNFFAKEIAPKYNAEIDRFLIHRNVQQISADIKNIKLPYNYLIQLSAKHTDDAKSVLLTESGIKNEYNKAIKISSDYLNVLDLQPYNFYEDLFYDFKNIPVKLSQNILFEKLYTPIQYRPDFTRKFLQDVYAPFFDNSVNFGYNYKEYIRFCDCILSERRYCVTYSFEELWKLTNIRRSALTKILEDVSFSSAEVNGYFKNFLSETNYRLRPLIKLKNEKYFLFSAYFNGFAFCEVLYNKLNLHYGFDFNRKKGNKVEKMVKNLFKEKNYQFHSGKYFINKGKNEECDMVIETSDKIVFVEIKNQPLPDTFEQGDDVETLRCLGEGMIKAQMQCFKHIRQLKDKGVLILSGYNHPPYELKLNNRQIICVSVCSQEYLFLTNKTFSECFLDSMLFATYHANDCSKENRLNKLNSLREKLASLIADIYGETKVHRVFFDTLFRSAQQVSTIINASDTLEDFVDNLTTPIYITDGTGDVYCQLINNKKIKGK